MRIRSDVLKKDRKNAGFTQSAFSAACRSVSLSTVRRAEQGYRVTEPAMRKMAQILDYPASRYIIKPDEDNRANYVAWLAGEWTCFYVEVEQGTTARLVSNALQVKQSGGQIVGEVVSAADNKRVVVEAFKAEVINNVATGRSIHMGGVAPSGIGTLYCLAKRHNGWLEGYFSGVAQNGDAVDNARFIAVRHNTPDYDQQILEATTIIEREVSMFRIKKLLEAGYNLDDALVMLAALRAAPH